MSKTIYIAGSSDEMDRASRCMREVEALGYDVTLDWVSVIKNAGGAANPSDVPAWQLEEWAEQDLDAVADADLFWLLVPQKGHARGAFVELGYAAHTGAELIASGPKGVGESIFVSLATRFDSDIAAIEWLKGRVRL